MRLQLVRVRGYKRLADTCSLDARGRVIAVVGPNEAGKTSLLDAMTHLSSDDPFDVSEYTDRKSPDEDDWIVSAHFQLEPDDLEALALPSGDSITWKVFRYGSGSLRHQFDPPIRRDTNFREKARVDLQRVVERGWLRDLALPEGSIELEGGLAALATAVWQGLDSAEENLETEALSKLRTLTEMLESAVTEDHLKTLQRLPVSLSSALDIEDSAHPSNQAAAVLQERMPEFLKFESEDRDLQAEYLWEENKRPPRPLENLFAMAGARFNRLRKAAREQDRPTVDDILLRAHARLQDELKAWRQDELFVTLSADQEKLYILVQDRETRKHTRFDERSAGLRSFIGLVAFTARFASAGARPVLLIDEAETHLHYAAQADLVRVFERQRVADTLIYTTHSIGCLPEDLGATIRVVAPTGPRRSVIRNSFWSGGEMGLTPMMVAMGAEALALTPSRRAVITEGPSDAIILPTLLREARSSAERDAPLGYQIAPGVAQIRSDMAKELEFEAGNVAYLVDSDPGGRGHSKKLSTRAKGEGRVVVLGEGAEEGLCTEDLVRAEILATAVNRVLGRHPDPPADRLSGNELPSVRRGAMIEDWCRQRGIEPPRKTEVAREALDLVAESSGKELVEPKRKDLLRRLHRALVEATGTSG